MNIKVPTSPMPPRIQSAGHSQTTGQLGAKPNDMTRSAHSPLPLILLITLFVAFTNATYAYLSSYELWDILCSYSVAGWAAMALGITILLLHPSEPTTLR